MKRKSYCLYILTTLLLTCTVINEAQAIPVRNISNLTSVTFWERTGGSVPLAYTFEVNSAQLTTRLTDPLSSSNKDFGGVPGYEFYDVFYSDANGTFNLDGEYLTIEGTYDTGFPAGGGLNLAEIGLNFDGTPTEFGNYVASFVALGNNAIPLSVSLAIDGNLQTHTTMGNTIGQSQRLRVSLGFLSSSIPVLEPATIVIFGIGLISIATARYLRRRRI